MLRGLDANPPVASAPGSRKKYDNFIRVKYTFAISNVARRKNNLLYLNS